MKVAKKGQQAPRARSKTGATATLSCRECAADNSAFYEQEIIASGSPHNSLLQSIASAVQVAASHFLESEFTQHAWDTGL
eukprot:scaffold122063_cov17-Tisochrysis_lutea.AAC.4